MTLTLEFDDYAHLRELLPAACVEECSCSGDNYHACEYWLDNILQLNISREKAIEELKQFGCWTEKELQSQSDKELKITYLWIAAGYES